MTWAGDSRRGVQYPHFRDNEVMVMTLGRIARNLFGGILAVVLTTSVCTLAQSKSGPVDPGVRGGPAGAGAPLKGLTADETAVL